MSTKSLVIALLCLALGGYVGYRAQSVFQQHASTPPSVADLAAEGSAPAQREVLFWYDPMYPNARFDQPGKSPFMDMDLVPRYAGEDLGATIQIDPAQVQKLALRTQKAQWGRLTFSRDLPGTVEFNAYQSARVQPRASGFVEAGYSLAVGDTVEAGEALAEITVPDWAADQSEYLLLKSQNAPAHVIRGVRERLRLSGMPEDMLQAVDRTGAVQTRLILRSPQDGVLTALEVYPGMNVEKSMTVATIQGIDPVWVTVEVPERDLHLVSQGSRIRLTASAYPDRVFYAASHTLLPQAKVETRTVPLRLSVPNGEGLLRPGMSVAIRLRATGEEAVLIPTQSLIDLGEEQRVIVRTDDSTFVPRRVTVQRSSGETTALLGGVEPGEDIVVTGLFLMDSEANLRGALDRMRGGGEEEEEHTHEPSLSQQAIPQVHNHGGSAQ